MENVTHALIMAASVLLLIIALSVSISSFTSLKSQVDSIIQESEDIDLAKDENGNYINYIKNADDIRTVRADTIISSVRRILKESYTIYIYSEGASGVVSQAESSSTTLKKTVIENQKDQYYNGEKIVESGRDIIKFDLAGSAYQNITNSAMEELYNIMKNKTFKEYLGIYQENAEGVSSANKQTYRVITFVEVEST